MKKNRYKLYIDKKPVAMVIGEKDYSKKEILHYFSQYFSEDFKEIKIVKE